MYEISDFENCCTASILSNLPWDHDIFTKKCVIKDEVHSILKYMYLDGDGACVVTLVDKQSKSIEALKEMGFHCSQPISKKRHKKNQLFVLYIDLQEYYKANCATKTPKRDAQGRFISNNPFKK